MKFFDFVVGLLKKRKCSPRFISFFAVIATLFGLSVAQAQQARTEAQFLEQIGARNPKTVVAVFDISNSMAHHFSGKPKPVLDIARPFALDLVNASLKKGDRFVLFTFDKTPRKISDSIVGDNITTLRDAIPSRNTLSTLKGTNIRWAHHEALKILDGEKRPAYLVVLSDGYHDSPDAADPNYVKYYIPMNLAKLPDTAEAKDYARLAQKFRSQAFGVGVQIAANGWVKEDPNPENDQVPTPAPSVTVVETPEEKSDWRKWLPVAIAILAAGIIGAGIYSAFYKPIRVGLGQPLDSRQNKIFVLKHGQSITLGGLGADRLTNAFGIANTSASVGAIVRRGQNFVLRPVAAHPDGAQIFVNSQPVTAPRVLMFGDQIKVMVPDKSVPGLERDQRFTFHQASAFKTTFG